MSNKNYESHRKAIVSKGIPPALLNRLTNSDVQVINTFLTRVSKLELSQQEKDWIIKSSLWFRQFQPCSLSRVLCGYKHYRIGI